MSNSTEVIKFIDGDIYMWLEQDSSIMLKAIAKTDPVELNADEAREVAKALILLADKLDSPA